MRSGPDAVPFMVVQDVEMLNPSGQLQIDELRCLETAEFAETAAKPRPRTPPQLMSEAKDLVRQTASRQ